MYFNVGRTVALLTLAQCLVANAAHCDLREFDFHVSNLQRNGVRRAVINGSSILSHRFVSAID